MTTKTKMSKEFVTYEQALALKELGFDERCLDAYYKTEEDEFLLVEFSDKEGYFKYPFEKIYAPLYQQAFRWFRNNHNLKSWVEEHTKDTFIYEIRPHKSSDYEVGEIYVYKTYEETELACLKKLIEIVKKK